MKKPVTTAALGAAFTLSLAGAHEAAANPFNVEQVATLRIAEAPQAQCGADKTPAEARCGSDRKPVAEAKCGASKQKAKEKVIREAKCGEAKCGSAE